MQTVALLALMTLAVSGDPRAERDRQTAREHYARGADALENEKFERAVTEFRAATRLDPEFTLAYYSLGQAYMALKSYPDAVDAYLECRSTIERRNKLDLQRRGEIERERDDQIRDIEDALRRWRSAFGTAPTETTLRLEQQLRLLQQERYKMFAGDLSVPVELSLALGSAYFRAGRLEKAEESYSEALAGNREFGAAHNNMAVIYLMTGRLDAAERAIVDAERSGFPVNPQLKEDIRLAREAAAKAPSPAP